MCTVVLLRRPGHRWPLIIAANRDEMRDRPWRAPARHWPDRPEIVAGLDELAGGSWLGLNDHGLVACVLNRRNALGPAPGLRSRGELVLDALDHADAEAAAAALVELDPRAYRGFNLVVADDRDAFWLRALGPEYGARVTRHALGAGISMLTATDLGDPGDARSSLHAPRFRAAAAPDPERGAYGDWETLLASREDGGNAHAAMVFRREDGFGTVSSALIALPARDRSEPPKPVFRFADGHPDSIRWRELSV